MNKNDFTVRITAYCPGQTLELMVRPQTDFDGQFLAYDPECDEIITVNGWLFDIDLIGDLQNRQKLIAEIMLVVAANNTPNSGDIALALAFRSEQELRQICNELHIKHDHIGA